MPHRFRAISANPIAIASLMTTWRDHGIPLLSLRRDARLSANRMTESSSMIPCFFNPGLFSEQVKLTVEIEDIVVQVPIFRMY